MNVTGKENYFSFVSNTCVVFTRIKLHGLQCSYPFQFALQKIGGRLRDIQSFTFLRSSTKPPVGEEKIVNTSNSYVIIQ